MLDILFFFTNREIFKQRPKPCKKNRPDNQGADHARKRLPGRRPRSQTFRLLSLLELRRI
ncbi:Phosphoribosylformylglycinamidine cyclo-ligase [Salmonella enterica subsp. enterica serovar Hvittingfoss str. A4-620]|nr:Phosphoribosylformylglycinamidine cyclo-ligase [Salmonella enterica subsp. enterica serovar Hvittingfoss str. A4-620]